MAHQLPVLSVPDAAGWASWLQDHGEESAGVWLVLAKKGTSEPTNLSYDDALAEAICHGWVDGQLASGDEKTFLRKFTPRRSRSRWSKRNVAIAVRMIKEGRMRSSGQAAISSAQADGSWDAAYASQANIDVPPDLESALAVNPEAKTKFASLSAANRYSILYRIATAKRSDTRQRRVEQFVAMLARGETIHPER
ncbi:MAG TPA: YdeI/OmpD-associated family protein [Candidatus Dormibacteraeota bacterium]